MFVATPRSSKPIATAVTMTPSLSNSTAREPIELDNGPCVLAPHAVEELLDESDHALLALQYVDGRGDFPTAVVSYLNVIGEHGGESDHIACFDGVSKRGQKFFLTWEWRRRHACLGLPDADRARDTSFRHAASLSPSVSAMRG
jgi:hypothetical protein